MCVCSLALGHDAFSQRAESSAVGRRQQDGSGHRDTERTVVSRPRNHFDAAYGTPTVTEKTPSTPVPLWALHQNVPDGVSVYCLNAHAWSAWSNTVREVQRRRTVCPSIDPVTSVAKLTPSFSFLLRRVPSRLSREKWTFMPRRAVARLVNR